MPERDRGAVRDDGPSEGRGRTSLERLSQALGELYPGRGPELLPRLLSLVEAYRKKNEGVHGASGSRGGEAARDRGVAAGDRDAAARAAAPPRFRAGDAILIAYGDMLRGGEPPLATLTGFCKRRLAGRFSHLHLLPFFPSSSDEGFSVTDFGSVDPRLGDWSHVERLGRSFGLAFDLVLNHASAKGDWFRGFLAKREPYDRFFVTRPEGFDASRVFRPRTHPLLTRFRRDDGSEVLAWTTFSPDQVDLDYSEPEVFLAMVETALSYAARGARILRLDAVAYAWKEDGTDCLDRPRVHALVRLFRAVLDEAAPGVSLLSETNLPQAVNDSYFGKGDEAQLAYNFALPPLALHAFVGGRAGYLASWAAGLPGPEPWRSYVNFLSSHDGIGLTPARGLLPPAELERLVAAAKERGSLVSERSTPEGPVPYELNTTFLDAIAPPGASDGARIRAFLSCHAAMAALAGVPAVYFHSLVGSRNWRDGPGLTGSKRSAHRERLDAAALERELDEPGTLRSRVYLGLLNMLAARGRRPAFDPASPQLVLSPDGSGKILAADQGGNGGGPCAGAAAGSAEGGRLPDGPSPDGPVFALLRGRGDGAVLAAVNVSEAPVACVLPRTFRPRGSPFDPAAGAGAAGGEGPRLDGQSLVLPPLGAAWLDGSLEGDGRCI